MQVFPPWVCMQNSKEGPRLHTRCKSSEGFQHRIALPTEGHAVRSAPFRHCVLQVLIDLQVQRPMVVVCPTQHEHRC